MRILWLSALVAWAMLPGAGAAQAATPAPAPAGPIASCPSVLLLESTNGKYYIAVFTAHAPTRASFEMTLYSKTAAYTASIANVEIAKPLTDENYTYRSLPAVIHNVDPDELLGASVAPTGPDAACPGQNVIIPSVASLTAPDRTVDPSVDALEAQLGAEAPKATVTTPEATSAVAVPACADPFDDASIDLLVRPALTAAQRANPDIGPIAVLVDVSATGQVLDGKIQTSSGNADVDALALAAARQSTFHPARFACEPERSSHVMRIEIAR